MAWKNESEWMDIFHSFMRPFNQSFKRISSVYVGLSFSRLLRVF